MAPFLRAVRPSRPPRSMATPAQARAARMAAKATPIEDVHQRRLSAEPRQQRGLGVAVTTPDRRARRGTSARSRRRSLLVLLATIAAIALTARLGVWQLDRASQKTTLQASLDRRSLEPPLDERSLARTPQAAEAQHFRRVVLHGHWLADRTVFLDNRQMDGRVGFFVVTPLALDTSGAVLVQRGWAAARLRRPQRAAAVATPTGGDRRRRRRPVAVAAVPVRRRRAADRSGKISTRRVRARDRASTCCRSRSRSTTSPAHARRRPRPALAAARDRRPEALRLRGQWFAIGRRHRLPLCLARFIRPRQALTRRRS